MLYNLMWSVHLQRSVDQFECMFNIQVAQVLHYIVNIMVTSFTLITGQNIRNAFERSTSGQQLIILIIKMSRFMTFRTNANVHSWAVGLRHIPTFDSKSLRRCRSKNGQKTNECKCIFVNCVLNHVQLCRWSVVLRFHSSDDPFPNGSLPLCFITLHTGL